MRSPALICMLALVASATPAAANIPATVTAVGGFNMMRTSTGIQMAGESQSAVVPPGVSTACPGGRLLVTMDGNRPDSFSAANRDSDAIRYINLDARAGSSPNRSLFTAPSTAFRTYGSNDHDIMVLRNGDVLFTWQMFIDSPMAPKPHWFNVTFRNTFGPGARTAMAIWRSTDCGTTFTLKQIFDPSTLPSTPQTPFSDCANPQTDQYTVADWMHNYATYVTPLPPGYAPPPHFFDMGGTDGAETIADPLTGRIFLTYRCVGKKLSTVPPPPGEAINLTDTFVGHTIVAFSDNEGQNWSPLYWIPDAVWRFGLVPPFAPQAAGTVAMLDGAQLVLSPLSALQPTTVNLGTGGGTWGWNPPANNAYGANVFSSPVIARAADGYVAAVPWIVNANGGSALGYRVFWFRNGDTTISEQAPILPSDCCKMNNGFVMHVVPDNVGTCTLLYWTDMDVVKQHATVLGRIVCGRTDYTKKNIAVLGHSTAGWSASTTPNAGGSAFFYGDYHTAGGYVTASARKGFTRTVFVPTWVQQDGRVGYAFVSFDRPNAPPGPGQSEHAVIRPAQIMHHWPKPDPRYMQIRGDDR